jgi:2-dehydropantoate 2-reductase
VTVIVLGAGAIGSFYGAKLSARHDVTLVARREHVERILADGLRVTGLEEATYRVHATTDVHAIAPGTLVLLTTKVIDSEAAVRPIVNLVRPDTVIVCVQNGLRSEEIVKRVVGSRCEVLRAITHVGAIFAGAGTIALKACGHTTFEPGPRSTSLADMFSACGLDGRISTNMRDEIWRKLVINCVVNPLTAITRHEVGWIADERLNAFKQAVIDECAAVARHDGATIDGDFLRVVNETFRPSRNLSSMHQDLLKGKRTEIDHLNGAVVELGKRFGIACPVNAGLVAIIKALEQRPGTRSA